MSVPLLIVLLMVLGGLAYWLGWFYRPSPKDVDRLMALAGAVELRQDFGDGLKIEWLGHSSFRMEWAGEVLLLDPVFSEHILATHRQLPVLVEAESLRASAVLISHGHMDHCDSRTLERLPETRVVVPKRTEDFLSEAVKARHKVEPMGDELVRIGALTIRRVKAVHGGWRYPHQRGYEATGYVISDGKRTLYYAGDTAWGPHFEAIGKAYAIDIAILPIGAYAPRFFLKSRHLCPEETVRAAQALGAKAVVVCHFGTYRLSLEGMGDPLQCFTEATQGVDLPWFVALPKDAND